MYCRWSMEGEVGAALRPFQRLFKHLQAYHIITESCSYVSSPIFEKQSQREILEKEIVTSNCLHMSLHSPEQFSIIHV